jgi:hypothetical protein
MAKTRLYTKEDLENAVNSVKEKKLSVRAAAKCFNIPFSTVQRAVATGQTTFKKFGAINVFN